MDFMNVDEVNSKEVNFNEMNIIEAIEGRKHIKFFKPDGIGKDTLLAWLNTASYAPNHRMNQPWEVILVGAEARAKLNHKANFGDAPVVLAFLSKTAENSVDRDENLIAVSCFIQNFSLIAHANGAGTRWTSVASLPHAREALQVSGNYEVVEVMGVGYPAEVPQAKPRIPMAEKFKQLD